jgi:hypothetical protein
VTGPAVLGTAAWGGKSFPLAALWPLGEAWEVHTRRILRWLPASARRHGIDDFLNELDGGHHVHGDAGQPAWPADPIRESPDTAARRCC